LRERAYKSAGYGMVTRVAVPGGSEDWADTCRENVNLSSLAEL